MIPAAPLLSHEICSILVETNLIHPRFWKYVLVGIKSHNWCRWRRTRTKEQKTQTKTRIAIARLLAVPLSKCVLTCGLMLLVLINLIREEQRLFANNPLLFGINFIRSNFTIAVRLAVGSEPTNTHRLHEGGAGRDQTLHGMCVSYMNIVAPSFLRPRTRKIRWGVVISDKRMGELVMTSRHKSSHAL